MVVSQPVIVRRYIEQIIVNNVPLFFFYVSRQFIEASIYLTSNMFFVIRGYTLKEYLQTITRDPTYLTKNYMDDVKAIEATNGQLNDDKIFYILATFQ